MKERRSVKRKCKDKEGHLASGVWRNFLRYSLYLFFPFSPFLPLSFYIVPCLSISNAENRPSLCSSAPSPIFSTSIFFLAVLALLPSPPRPILSPPLLPWSHCFASSALFTSTLLDSFYMPAERRKRVTECEQNIKEISATKGKMQKIYVDVLHG